jgi:tRNA G10  N-methylase Trm11
VSALQLNHCTVGDSLAILPTLADGSFDAVISDRPYGVKIDTWDDSALNHLLPEYLRIARGAVALIGAAPRLWQDLEEFAVKPERTFIWAPAFTNSHTQSSGTFYRYHPIFVWRMPAKHQGPKHDVLKHNAGGVAGQRDPWHHVCTKPERLMADLAGLVPEGGTILDPFGGSGSTAIGAIRRGRKAALIEIDPIHAATANGRIEAELAGQSYAAHLAGQRMLVDVGPKQRRKKT